MEWTMQIQWPKQGVAVAELDNSVETSVEAASDAAVEK